MKGKINVQTTGYQSARLNERMRKEWKSEKSGKQNCNQDRITTVARTNENERPGHIRNIINTA